MGITEARRIKENQAVPAELRTIRNGIDDYWKSFFGTRGCAVPDSCDIFAQRSVNELGTTQHLNDWVVIALRPGSPCFFQPRLDP